MTQDGTWVSYSGDARIGLAVGLLVVAGGVAYAGTRLRLSARFTTRPDLARRASLITAWALSGVIWLVCVSIYLKHYLDLYPKTQAAPANPITPVTFGAAAVVFVIILSRSTPSFAARLGSAFIGAMAAAMIFELPFDLIVMARTYPALSPDPAGYRALFFAPLFLLELLTLALLRLSPMVRLTRWTFFSFALLLVVFAVWAVAAGFSYPSAPLPIALNMTSKILAFVTMLTAFQLRGGHGWLSRPAAQAEAQAQAGAGAGGAQPSLPGRAA